MGPISIGDVQPLVTILWAGHNQSSVHHDPNAFAYRFRKTELELKVKDDEVLRSRIDSMIELPDNGRDRACAAVFITRQGASLGMGLHLQRTGYAARIHHAHHDRFAVRCA